jgi:hypothetical protein
MLRAKTTTTMTSETTCITQLRLSGGWLRLGGKGREPAPRARPPLCTTVNSCCENPPCTAYSNTDVRVESSRKWQIAPDPECLIRGPV